MGEPAVPRAARNAPRARRPRRPRLPRLLTVRETGATAERRPPQSRAAIERTHQRGRYGNAARLRAAGRGDCNTSGLSLRRLRAGRHTGARAPGMDVDYGRAFVRVPESAVRPGKSACLHRPGAIHPKENAMIRVAIITGSTRPGRNN